MKESRNFHKKTGFFDTYYSFPILLVCHGSLEPFFISVAVFFLFEIETQKRLKTGLMRRFDPFYCARYIFCSIRNAFLSSIITSNKSNHTIQF